MTVFFIWIKFGIKTITILGYYQIFKCETTKRLNKLLNWSEFITLAITLQNRTQRNHLG